MLTVIVPTCGDLAVWEPLAQRAVGSVQRQTIPVPVKRVHAETVMLARNRGAAEAESEWLCFLDADDELDCRYIQSMEEAILPRVNALYRPATLGVVDGIEDEHPVMIERRDIRKTNFAVIGTVIRREQFLRLGGFLDYPIFEDWELWLRCVKDGAEIVDVPEAIYRVHVRPGSRNSDTKTATRVYRQIREKHR